MGILIESLTMFTSLIKEFWKSQPLAGLPRSPSEISAKRSSHKQCTALPSAQNLWHNSSLKTAMAHEEKFSWRLITGKKKKKIKARKCPHVQTVIWTDFQTGFMKADPKQSIPHYQFHSDTGIWRQSLQNHPTCWHMALQKQLFTS